MAKRTRPARKAVRKGARAVTPPAAGATKVPARAGGFELRELRRLIRLVQSTGIGELELTSGDRAVRIAANSIAGHAPIVSAAALPAGDPASSATPPAVPAAPASTLKAVTSPMVGTFYRAPAPDADPFAETGDIIEVGQTVCIIEAMKLMNEIEAEFRGRVVQILVENAQPVEFGQKLFLVEPA